MWNRQQVKEQAKQIMKRNYWKMFVVTLIAPSSTGFGLAISTPAMRNNSTGDFVHPPFKKDKYASISACVQIGRAHV